MKSRRRRLSTATVLTSMLLVSALASLSAGAGGAATPKGEQHFFFGPGVTTSCELDASMPKIGSAAYCQTYPHAESVTLRANGKLTICHGIKCIGNPPDQVPTLVYGAWLSAGPFRCTSTRAGIRCIVTRTKHGFLISAAKITRV